MFLNLPTKKKKKKYDDRRNKNKLIKNYLLESKYQVINYYGYYKTVN